MTSPVWLDRLIVEAIHFDQIRLHGGLPGIRDENALESALARPRNREVYDTSSDLAALAAQGTIREINGDNAMGKLSAPLAGGSTSVSDHIAL